MRMINSMNDLIAVVQLLRTEKYPDLPDTLVTQILGIEADFLENQAEALKRIAHLVESYLHEEKN